MVQNSGGDRFKIFVTLVNIYKVYKGSIVLSDSTKNNNLIYLFIYLLLNMAPLEIIGAGFGRTGTDSLRLALNKLGYVLLSLNVIDFN
jgi:hypothetical protein